LHTFQQTGDTTCLTFFLFPVMSYERIEGKAEAEERGYLSILYDFFRSLKLTITLLILLAIISIIGTLISQNGNLHRIHSTLRDQPV